MRERPAKHRQPAKSPARSLLTAEERERRRMMLLRRLRGRFCDENRFLAAAREPQLFGELMGVYAALQAAQAIAIAQAGLVPANAGGQPFWVPEELAHGRSR